MNRSIEGELVLVSDVHIRSPNDARCLALISLINATSCKTFVLNGDIFDFCLGDKKHFRTKFQNLGDALTRLVERGCRVLFIEGNHEFHMEHIGWRGVEIFSGETVILTMADGAKVAVCHGDLVTEDPWYKIFRAVVKSAPLRFLARFIPARFLDAYALGHSQISRSRDEYRDLNHSKVLHGVERWLNRVGCTVGIIGHFHVPYAETFANGAKLLSVKSWDEPNALLYDAGRFSRILIAEKGSYAKEPTKSVLRELSETQSPG